MVRKYLLGSKTGRETELTKAALPDLPFAGMYCTGEISPIGDGRGPRFLNETFVALLLGT
jgi:small ligand-binding sensory domain FIST